MGIRYTTTATKVSCVGFMADSGMFAMVRGHGISAFPNTVLIKTEFPQAGEAVRTCL